MKSKIKNTEYEVFNKLSEEWWDENGKFKVLHQIRQIRIKYILNQFKNKKIKNLDILDLGCGGGLVCEPLSRLGANVTGIDFVKNNISVAKLHAKQKKLNITYINDNVEKLNFTKKFDLIILFEVLEHLEDWKKFLIKINKSLKSNGLIIISTINRTLISKYLAIYFAENILKWIPKGTHNHNKFIKPNEIKKCLESYNLKLKNIKGLVFNPIKYEWELSDFTKINFFCTYSKN